MLNFFWVQDAQESSRPRVFKDFQRLSSPAREFAKELGKRLRTFPPDTMAFELKHDLNAPVLVVLARSEGHLRLELNAEYHLFRGECIVVHLAEKTGKDRHEKRPKKIG